MFYLYLLRSDTFDQLYVGSTKDLRQRLKEHNSGKHFHTNKYKPWKLEYYEAFSSERAARMREKKLKQHGNAKKELYKRIGLITKSGAGFTLIELLIVIAILGALASIVMIAYPASQKKARDSQRQSDIKQYQTLLEIYASSNNNLYPSVTAGNINGLCTAIALNPCVTDPSTLSYQVVSSTLEYKVWAELEVPDAAGDTQYFITCSNGQSGVKSFVSGSPTTTTTCDL